MRKNVFNNEGEDIRFVEREKLKWICFVGNKGEEYKEKTRTTRAVFTSKTASSCPQRYLEALKVLIEFEAAKTQTRTFRLRLETSRGEPQRL